MLTENLQELSKQNLISLVVQTHQQLLEQQAENEKLTNAIRNANKKLFGTKSEKLITEDQQQLKLSFEKDPEQLPIITEKEIIVEKYTRTISKGRKPLPDNLPREEIIYEPEETHCGCCKGELVKIGEVRTEELEKIPAQLKVIEHVRIKKACPHCKEAGVLIPTLPPSVLPLERARPGAGLLADIIVSKYVDHIPLHRQEQMFLRHGIELSRKRMCDWVGKVAELLSPVYEQLHKEVLLSSYVQADETRIKVQDSEKEGQCHIGYLWGVHAPPLNMVWFVYNPSRSGEVPKKIFNGYQGEIQTDAYAGYNPVFLPEGCKRIACLAHIRRKFIELESIAGKERNKVLNIISEIYRIERKAKIPEERFSLRQGKTKKLFEELFNFLSLTAERTLPKSALMPALNYALWQKEEVFRILDNGYSELDNNGIERLIRPIAIGRKNYLFAGSHQGAQSAAVFYSLFGTCRINKVNPWAWLKDVLEKIAVPGIKLQQLMPHRWNK